MAISNIIARGIGFSPGGVKFIVTHGLSLGAAVAESIRMLIDLIRLTRIHYPQR